MHGFLNIDKPLHMTSFDVIRKIKKAIPRGVKVGHLGTLDPMAAGVLPIALGKATKVIYYIDDTRKTYIAEITLGFVSDTQDAWGNIAPTGKTHFEMEKLNEVLKQFTGPIKQLPPMYSAVHHQGKRLYELARQGITVDREEREITVYSLELLDINEESGFPVIKLQVDCSRGTYVRTLGHDIGARLGTGAIMSSLQRVCSGPFTIDQVSALEQILQDKDRLESYLIPIDYPLAHIPAIHIKSEAKLNALANGQAVALDETMFIRGTVPAGLVRVYSDRDDLLALARAYHDGTSMLRAERVFK